MQIKKALFLIILLLAVNPVLAQDINLDSIVKVVAARNPPKAHPTVINKDSLFKRLPYAKPGAARVKLIADLYTYAAYPDIKQNIDMGYRILNWAKVNHDLISEAAISSFLSSTIAGNGDKAVALQLQNEAMAAATQSRDNTALGIAYLNYTSFVMPNFNKNDDLRNNLKCINFFRTSGNALMLGWGYAWRAGDYAAMNKMDSAIFYAGKSLEYAVRANNIFEICTSMGRYGFFSDTAHLGPSYLKAAYILSKRANDEMTIGSTALSLADYYRRVKKNLDSALYYANEAYSINKREQLDQQRYNVYLLSDIYQKKRNIDSALKYAWLYNDIDEKLNNNTSLIRAQAAEFAQKQKQQQAEADEAALKSRQQRWVLGIIITFLFVIAFIFWRNNRLSKKANLLLKHQKQQTEMALSDLKATQQQLIQSEKMASLGELTAGIAHEIQNPLNFVNNFSEVNREMLEELRAELRSGNMDEALAIVADIEQNEEKITHHGKRADGIVKGMLQHSRASSGTKEPTDLNALAYEYLRLAYHGLRAKDKSFNAELVTSFDEHLPKVNVIPQDIGRVMLNLFTNAFYAVQQKQKTAGPDYKPTVTISTFAPPSGGWGAAVHDNGIGIPEEIKDKILQPFFTTKPTGEGTGLGLSLSYDIVVKAHGGKIDVQSIQGEGSEFTIKIPLT